MAITSDGWHLASMRITPSIYVSGRFGSTGSGTSNPEVNRLVKQFEMMQKMTKQMAGGGLGKAKAMKEMIAGGGDMMPGVKGLPGFGGRASTKTKSVKSGFKQRCRPAGKLGQVLAVWMLPEML